MAVSVPGSKEQVTALTATWPPKRMVKSLVAKVLMGGGSLSRVSSGSFRHKGLEAPAGRQKSLSTSIAQAPHNWSGPGQRPPRKGRPAALAVSPFPNGVAIREKGEGAKRLRGLYICQQVPIT
jgi:hypothetical protein